MATEKLNKEKELVGKVLSDEADSRELHELSEMPFMDRRMRAQWEAGNRMPADATWTTDVAADREENLRDGQQFSYP